MRSALDTNVLIYAEGIGDQVRIEKIRSLLALEKPGAALRRHGIPRPRLWPEPWICAWTTNWAAGSPLC